MGCVSLNAEQNPRRRDFVVFDFEKPKIEIAEISEDKTYGKFVVEPLERYDTW